MGKKFDDIFDEPQPFSSDHSVLSREKYSKEEAAKIFNEHLTRDVTMDEIMEDTVKFGIGYHEDDPNPDLTWWLGRSGRGCKRVWIC